MYTKKALLFFTIFIILNLGIQAQVILSGSVNDGEGNGLVGAEISVSENSYVAITDEIGEYRIEISAPGEYSIEASYLGFSTQVKSIKAVSGDNFVDFILSPDPLEMTTVVILDRNGRKSQLQLAQKINTLDGQTVPALSAYGSADLLGNINGVYADGSAGEIFTRVYSRGISISAEDDLGWFYTGLEEDGLPVAATQHTYFGPDLFHRADITLDRIEGINGGKSSILGVNTPGSIFNFISRKGSSEPHREIRLSAGVDGVNTLGRIDALLSGPLANRWTYMVGGFYRRGGGGRSTDLDWNKGGQVRLNLTKINNNSSLRLYGKYLNDHTNRYTGLPAQNWDEPIPAFGFNFSEDALMLPSVNGTIADGRTSGSMLNFNTDNGVYTRDLSMGIDGSLTLGKWTLRNNLKFSSKKAEWDSSIGNQPLGLEGFFPYLLSGISPDFSVLPLGVINFSDVNTGELVASVNNFGILGPLMGQPPSFEYLSGSLPNDALMGIAPWKKIDSSSEWMNRLTMNAQYGNHQLATSAFISRSTIETFTSGSFAYATYEKTPRLLQAIVENPGAAPIFLSDENGLSNYGGLFYNRGEAVVNQAHFYLNDTWDFSENWTVDAGIQWSRVSQSGDKFNAAPTGDLDDNPATAFNNSTLQEIGSDAFDHTYNNVSWSAGILRELSPSSSTFIRISQGRKSPELNYVFSNFQGVPIGTEGRSQRVIQYEAGYRNYGKLYGLSANVFYSQLKDVGFSEFVFDNDAGQLFFTPEQINESETLGLMLEGSYLFSRFLSLTANATIQNPKAGRFTVYNANGTADESDDEIRSFKGNQLPHNPKFTFRLTPEVSIGKNSLFLRYEYIGSRQGNIANAFQLPAFGTLDLGFNFAYDDQTIISIYGHNLLNSAGLMNFYGPNEFGSSANAASQSYISNNPEASFVVFPIMPRRINVELRKSF